MKDCTSGVIVIGGGMAGASIAAQLAPHCPVRLLEMENHVGFHSTGRSAARFSEAYGNIIIRALSRASRSFFLAPPEGFCSAPLLTPRPDLILARTGQREALDAYAETVAPGARIERLSPQRAVELCPILRPEGLSGALLDSSPADIDVHALHQGYLKLFKARGGTVTTNSQVLALERRSDLWQVATPHAMLHASVVVNAAGAWAGELGKMAGARDIGMQPMRRTAVLIEPPSGVKVDAWPMVADLDESFYFKPDAGRLLLSPADETPAAACDIQPDELDVAIAVDRLEQATTLKVTRIAAQWAGLRSFVKDRSPCVGFDSLQPGFFWSAALGGYGIQTAPALSALAAALVLDIGVDAAFSACGLDRSSLDPSRQ